MNEDVDTVNIKQASQWITHELQNFMIEKNLVRSKEWKEIILELEKQVEVEEEPERQEAIRTKESEEMLVRMRDSIREEVQGEMRRARATAPRRYTYRPIECFKCMKEGHIARNCSFGAEGRPQERVDSIIKNLSILSM
ncbi:Gag polyprotein [Nosema granulosis]|uniref:Gag polyprotein n=1 Tax=Nosema granulosis TaxID=83296 RepID=A0A9P6GWF6_9MICR|nr:Gag polyprotein [Nosema granulosis]